MKQSVNVRTILSVTPLLAGIGVLFVALGIIEFIQRNIGFFLPFGMILAGVFNISIAVNSFKRALILISETKSSPQT